MTDQKATNITWHAQNVTTQDLEKLHGHKGVTIWFTGLSASGKSTIANAVAAALHARGLSTFVLDGDNIRHGLNKDLGFSPEDRVQNIRRIGEVAKLFTSAAVINCTAFISPYAADRKIARDLQPETFLEVYCKCEVDVCETRDPNGLYKKAKAGQIKEFTGVSAPYEAPERPEVLLDTGKLSVGECAATVIETLKSRGFVS
jgi:adenylylsulfate kinase